MATKITVNSLFLLVSYLSCFDCKHIEAASQISDIGIHRNLCNGRKSYNQKILSYALFGNGTRENSGKGENYVNSVKIIVDQARKSNLYRNWIIRIYHDNGVAAQQALSNGNLYGEQVEFCNIHTIADLPNLKKILGKFWRNIPMIDPTVDVTCFRDLDSDLTEREEHAVRMWLKTDKVIHSMRDNPVHRIGMLAGMWCFRNDKYRELGVDLFGKIYENAMHYKLRSDQPLLNEIVWDKLWNNSIQHDAYTCNFYPGSIPFPVQRKDKNSFVGCSGHGCYTDRTVSPCPIHCRPTNHRNWLLC